MAEGPAGEERPLPPGGVPLGDPPWEPWHPAQLAQILKGVTAPWYVAAGWAIDLFCGKQTRGHEDLEMGLPNTPEAFAEVRRALAGFEILVPGGLPPQIWPLDSPAFDIMHQTWVSETRQEEPRGRVFRVDIFREPQRNGLWVCRRDENIVLPYDQIICHDQASIPYLAPQFVLLFKAKHARDKDLADLNSVLPLLSAGQRQWLAATIQRLHPGHEWLGLI